MRARSFRGNVAHHIHTREKRGPASDHGKDAKQAQDALQCPQLRLLDSHRAVDVGEKGADQRSDGTAGEEEHRRTKFGVHRGFGCPPENGEHYECRRPVKNDEHEERAGCEAILLPLDIDALEPGIGVIAGIGRHGGHNHPSFGRIMTRTDAHDLAARIKTVRCAQSNTGGDGGIRTLDTAFDRITV
jgi:hypothetical protein